MAPVPNGFNPDGVLTLDLAPNLSKYPWDMPRREAYFQELLVRFQALPGIQSAGLTSFLPIAQASLVETFQFEDRPPVDPGKMPCVHLNHISQDYFRTIGVQVRAGRPFSAQDGPKSQLVTIINETMTWRFFANECPIDRRLFLPLERKDPKMHEGRSAASASPGVRRYWH